MSKRSTIIISPARRRHMDEMDRRRAEQRSREPGFLYMGPPTDPRNALRFLHCKTGTFYPGMTAR